MQTRPLVGIATQTLEPIPGQVPLAWVMGQRYVKVLTAAGAVPWVIPLLQDDEETLGQIYHRLDGVFLTGGVDVEPAAYQEPRHDLCGKTDGPRDWTEMRLVRWALRDGKPVLGVCRGIQVMNVACGGALYQDLHAQYAGAIKHDYFPPTDGFTRSSLVHKVRIQGDSRLGRILGTDEVPVNSMHHQGIKQLAAGLAPSAFAPDGLIEGVEGANGHFAVGVQWHPEELADTDPVMRRLFQAFIDAAVEFARTSIRRD